MIWGYTHLEKPPFAFLLFYNIKASPPTWTKQHETPTDTTSDGCWGWELKNIHCFQWSPPKHIISLIHIWHVLVGIQFGMFSNILYEDSIWHVFWYFVLHISWTSFWHTFRSQAKTFWHRIWHAFLPSIWHSFWRVFWHFSRFFFWHCIGLST